MSATGFILTINLLVAGLFAAAFCWLSRYEKVRPAARWVAASFLLGMASYGIEWLVAAVARPRFVVFTAFTLTLVALCIFTAGMAAKYLRPAPWRLIGVLLLVSLPLNLAIYDMPRDSFLRVLLYQLPYCAIQAVTAWLVLKASKDTLDRLLGTFLALSSLHFLSKPFLSTALGTGNRPQTYVDSAYALVSQSMGSVLLVAAGLLVGIIMVRDVLAEATQKSETDPLTGLLNRRGFSERARLVGQRATSAGIPASIVICDLDHFKSINDTYGHATGDRVISAFAAQLQEAVADEHVVGRIGGEEFAVVLPGTNASAARLFAEGVRNSFSTAMVDGLPATFRPTASFGVAELREADTLSDMLRRADLALYEAKASGRDCVRVAAPYFGSVDRRSLRPT